MWGQKQYQLLTEIKPREPKNCFTKLLENNSETHFEALIILTQAKLYGGKDKIGCEMEKSCQIALKVTFFWLHALADLMLTLLFLYYAILGSAFTLKTRFIFWQRRQQQIT